MSEFQRWWTMDEARRASLETQEDIKARILFLLAQAKADGIDGLITEELERNIGWLKHQTVSSAVKALREEGRARWRRDASGKIIKRKNQSSGREQNEVEACSIPPPGNPHAIIARRLWAVKTADGFLRDDAGCLRLFPSFAATKPYGDGPVEVNVRLTAREHDPDDDAEDDDGDEPEPVRPGGGPEPVDEDPRDLPSWFGRDA